MTTEERIQEAKKFLEEQGYFTRNLWHVGDVMSKYICDKKTAQEVLLNTLTNSHIVEEIQESMYYIAEVLNLSEIED